MVSNEDILKIVLCSLQFLIYSKRIFSWFLMNIRIIIALVNYCNITFCFAQEFPVFVQ